METLNPSEKDQQLFLTLVADLTTQSWIALGKINNPVTNQSERNIPAAGILIDMLDMLIRKTDGNLDEGEAHVLTDSVRQLKMNYVDEVNKPDPEPAEITDDSDTDSESDAPAESTPEEEQNDQD